MNELRRIDALLSEKLALPGDGSLLMDAIGATEPLTTYQKVEVLIAAWEEMHREAVAALPGTAE